MATLTAKRKVGIRQKFDRLTAHAEKIKNDAPQVVRTMSRGDAWPQGDLLLVYLGEDKPQDLVVDAQPMAQLAPGTTQGSRHVLQNYDDVKLWRRSEPTELDGPVIEAPNGIIVDHPEHGQITCEQGGYYGVVYQRQLADELARVRD